MKGDATGERCLGLFLLGLLAFSPPVLSLFRIETLVLGLPLLCLYLFAAWAILIALLALIVHAAGREEGDEPPAPPPSRG